MLLPAPPISEPVAVEEPPPPVPAEPEPPAVRDIAIETPLAPIDETLLDAFPPLPGMEEGNFIGLQMVALDETDKASVDEATSTRMHSGVVFAAPGRWKPAFRKIAVSPAQLGPAPPAGYAAIRSRGESRARGRREPRGEGRAPPRL